MTKELNRFEKAELFLQDLEKKDKELAIKNGTDYYLWDTAFMTARIKPIIKSVWGCYFINDLSYWYAVRLKFTRPEIQALAKDMLNGEVHYEAKVFDWYVFEVMAEYKLCYPEALVKIDLMQDGANEMGEYKELEFPNPTYEQPNKLYYALLGADNKTIIYGVYPSKFMSLIHKSEEEIKKNFNLDIVRAIEKHRVRGPMTDEEAAEFDKYMDSIMEQVRLERLNKAKQEDTQKD